MGRKFSLREDVAFIRRNRDKPPGVFLKWGIRTPAGRGLQCLLRPTSDHHSLYLKNIEALPVSAYRRISEFEDYAARQGYPELR